MASTSSHTLISLVNALPTFATNFRYVKIIGRPHCLYATHLHVLHDIFAFSAVLHSLTILVIICNIFLPLCSIFTTPHNIFAIFNVILWFIIVTSDIYRSSRPNALSPSPYPSLRHRIQQKSPETSHTSHCPPSTVPIAMPARGNRFALHFDPRQP